MRRYTALRDNGAEAAANRKLTVFQQNHRRAAALVNRMTSITPTVTRITAAISHFHFISDYTLHAEKQNFITVSSDK